MGLNTITTNAEERKAIPLARGLLDYFPSALVAVAALSAKGNAQHNGGDDLHWARDKSNDHADALLRHLIDRGKIDTDGIRHSAKVAWRALALLQEELEREEGAPLPRNAKVPALPDDGWCEWHGGKRPVATDARVDVVLRNKEEVHDTEAGFLLWSHAGSDDDIVAWRPAKSV